MEIYHLFEGIIRFSLFCIIIFKYCELMYIKFDKKSVIQGVIMSEVLQKPKSLRR